MLANMSRFNDRISMEGVDERVLYEVDRDRHVASITLNRPETLNAMTVPMRERINDRVHDVNLDDDVRVLVLRGNGRVFSSGDEINENWNQKPPGRRMAINEHARMLNDVMSGRGSFSQTISRCHKVVIAQVH